MLSDNESILDQDPTVAVSISSTVGGAFEACDDREFQRGFARATNQILALHPLLVEQFLHARKVNSEETRELLRTFSRFVEAMLDGQVSADTDFVNDGLGI